MLQMQFYEISNCILQAPYETGSRLKDEPSGGRASRSALTILDNYPRGTFAVLGHAGHQPAKNTRATVQAPCGRVLVSSLLFGLELASARAAKLRVMRVSLAAVRTCCRQQRVPAFIAELVDARVAHAASVTVDNVWSYILLIHRTMLTLSVCHHNPSYTYVGLLATRRFPIFSI